MVVVVVTVVVVVFVVIRSGTVVVVAMVVVVATVVVVVFVVIRSGPGMTLTWKLIPTRWSISEVLSCLSAKVSLCVQKLTVMYGPFEVNFTRFAVISLHKLFPN